MSGDPSHASLVLFFNNISGSKMLMLRRNSMPQTNNMDAKHCAGQTLILDFQLKRYLEGLFDGFSCQNKDPGLNFRRNYTLRGKHTSGGK